MKIVSFRTFRLHMSTNSRAIRWRAWCDERVRAQRQINRELFLVPFYPDRLRDPLQQQYIDVRRQGSVADESRLRLQLIEQMHIIVSDEPIDWRSYAERKWPFAPGEDGPLYKMATILRDTYRPTLYDRLYDATEQRWRKLSNIPAWLRESDEQTLQMYEASVADAKAIVTRDYDQWPEILATLIPFAELQLLDTTVDVHFTPPLTARLTIGEGAVPKTKMVVDELGELREETMEQYDALYETFVGNVIVRVARDLARIYPVREIVVVVDDVTVTIDTEALRQVDWSTTTSWSFIRQQVEGRL